MNRLERLDSSQEALLAAFRGLLAELWTSTPGIVQNFDPTAMTVTVQPAIQSNSRAPDGSESAVPLPLLVDVPVIFLGGGPFVTTYPIAPGDEALIVVASRCIDAWWMLGGVQPQAERRMHHLSDAIAIVGLWSQPRTIPNISTNSLQIRNKAGDVYIEIDENGKVRIQATDIQLHATHSYSWDVNGFGQGVTYAGDNTWNVHTWQTPRPQDHVTATNTPIAPPEGP